MYACMYIYIYIYITCTCTRIHTEVDVVLIIGTREELRDGDADLFEVLHAHTLGVVVRHAAASIGIYMHFRIFRCVCIVCDTFCMCKNVYVCMCKNVYVCMYVRVYARNVGK